MFFHIFHIFSENFIIYQLKKFSESLFLLFYLDPFSNQYMDLSKHFN